MSSLSNDLTDPTVFAVIVAALLGWFVYHRQLVLKRRIKLTDGFSEKLDDISDSISELTNLYRQAVDALANIGDKYKNTPVQPTDSQVDEITKEVEGKFKTIQSLIDSTFSTKKKITKLVDNLAGDPLIANKFSNVSNSLRKESNEIGFMVDRSNNLLIPLNTLPPNLSGGQNVSPPLFQAIVSVINETVANLQEFQRFSDDTKKIIHNRLVGSVWFFKKYKPAYLEQRRAMTKNGVRDYSVESSKWLRIKMLVRAIWG